MIDGVRLKSASFTPSCPVFGKPLHMCLFCVCVCFRWVGKCHPSWLGVERTAVINVIQYSVCVQFFSIVSKLSCSSWCVCIRIQMRFARCTRWALHLVDMTPEPLTFFHVIYSGRRLSHLSSRVSGFGWLHLCDDVSHSVQGSRSGVVGVQSSEKQSEEHACSTAPGGPWVWGTNGGLGLCSSHWPAGGVRTWIHGWFWKHYLISREEKKSMAFKSTSWHPTPETRFCAKDSVFEEQLSPSDRKGARLG